MIRKNSLESKRRSVFGKYAAAAVCFCLFFLLPEARIFAQAPISYVKHPVWSRNLTIYEVNIRQYTPSGTFKEFEEHLPRLKDLGVGILWLMPINPIGEKNRKGSLGSYYSVKDYLAVNPEFGTLDDFKSLVKHIHDLGMYVIIDWVANHTSWDNTLVTMHPEWYTKDSTGSFVPSVPDWTDVIDLDYSQPALRSYMTDAMKYWITETDIDGFRCDAAGMVPIEFWDSVRVALDKIKPVFMLAEDEQPQCHSRAFDMTYGWELNHLMNDVANRKKTVGEIARYFAESGRRYPTDAYRMYFTSNHDENSWNGTEFERLGDGAAAFAVLAATARGMFLVYSGQEAELNQRLRFFDKDTIIWRPTQTDSLFRKLIQLKRDNPALWNGDAGGNITTISASSDNGILAFSRGKDHHQVLVVLNLSDSPRTFALQGKALADEYRDIFTDSLKTFKEQPEMQLRPWGYRVFTR
jgi:cyclomaltodextrinase / maltogenic alpha-amylase / neopullulanase